MKAKPDKKSLSKAALDDNLIPLKLILNKLLLSSLNSLNGHFLQQNATEVL
jgi:hypothetical protein